VHIRIHKLFKTFGKNPVVRNLSLEIQSGERIAIIGPSGCGKSTLLRMIMGLQMPDSGVVEVDGSIVSEMSRADLRKLRLNMGLVFQQSALFDSLTVGQNVAFTLVENKGLTYEDARQEVFEKLGWVGLKDIETRMPAELSGGMKKRAALARAIIGGPKVILYDEPTTGLDPIISTNIEDLILSLNERLGLTSIVVTHQQSTMLRTADKIYMMQDGCLLDFEKPSTIAQSKNPDIRSFFHGGLKQSLFGGNP